MHMSKPCLLGQVKFNPPIISTLHVPAFVSPCPMSDARPSFAPQSVLGRSCPSIRVPRLALPLFTPDGRLWLLCLWTRLLLALTLHSVIFGDSPTLFSKTPFPSVPLRSASRRRPNSVYRHIKIDYPALDTAPPDARPPFPSPWHNDLQHSQYLVYCVSRPRLSLLHFGIHSPFLPDFGNPHETTLPPCETSFERSSLLSSSHALHFNIWTTYN